MFVRPFCFSGRHGYTHTRPPLDRAIFAINPYPTILLVSPSSSPFFFLHSPLGIGNVREYHRASSCQNETGTGTSPEPLQTTAPIVNRNQEENKNASSDHDYSTAEMPITSPMSSSRPCLNSSPLRYQSESRKKKANGNPRGLTARRWSGLTTYRGRSLFFFRIILSTCSLRNDSQ